MNDLAIAYHEWSQEIKYDNDTHKFIHGKGVDKIRTRGGELYSSDEWALKALEYIHTNDLKDIYSQVQEFVTKNCMWFKYSEIELYALDCVLHESYKKWDGFNYQERLNL